MNLDSGRELSEPLGFAAEDRRGTESILRDVLARTRERLQVAGLAADLQLRTVGERLPYADGYFDAAYAWQVLYYNDAHGWTATVAELSASPGAAA